MEQRYSFPLEPQLQPQPIPRPLLHSFDSGPECSLDHWMEISWLVEHEEDESEGYLFEDTCFVGSR